MRLRNDYGVDHLVCLLEDHELGELAISDLPRQAGTAGIEFHRLPIHDGGTPVDTGAVEHLVGQITRWAAAGKIVAIHCKGGLGRAGTVGGCVLRASGLDGPSTLDALLRARGPHCPETAAQREYINEFMSRHPPAT